MSAAGRGPDDRDGQAPSQSGGRAGAAGLSALVVSSPGELELSGGVFAIGNFDGVHLGHRMLLGRMHEIAAATGRPAIVLTFFPTSRMVFGDHPYLASAEEKLELLAAFSPTAVVMIPFSREYALTDKALFLEQLRRLEPHTLIVGEDFRFGHGRAGGLDDLRLATSHLEAFGLKHLGAEVVRSSRVREHLAAGRIAEANAMLGEPYLARGAVVAGAKRGREIGFPTANLELGAKKALPIGVFAVTVTTKEGRHQGMANVGPRPSFPDGAPALEVHLFDFAGDLYGQVITTRFHAHLRDQRRFAGLEELKQQLAKDAADARRALGTLA